MKLNILFGLITLITSCDDNNIQGCITGTIIGYEQCSNAVLIMIDSKEQIGRSMTYYDNSSYENVVRAPGELGQYGNATIYFSYRPYKKEKDSLLYKYSNSPCLAIYGPFDVPTVVITDFSTEDCAIINL